MKMKMDEKVRLKMVKMKKTKAEINGENAKKVRVKMDENAKK